ncbi:MAG: hypothetical protein U0T74_02775 [Chitinophagales bacterium]
MNRNYLTALLISTWFLAFNGCRKEEAISNIPSISFISVTPNPAVKYQDELVITLECTDGDGDVGENTPDVKNVFVTDSRNNVTSSFRLSQLAPDNAGIIVRGRLNIHLLPPGFVDDSHSTETVTYSVYLKDRAGHTSNTIQTTAVTINL